ncbi:hypothetical protein HanRHA438_Chr17g0840031 [Helianthus annuus]|nr:hypothetical protein HanIR_Chr17g0900821 [Helianthus annuus]KAJ0828692.1 hypothetical protein HanRHA438_Chr17g0840031 [Helianthus annuus]
MAINRFVVLALVFVAMVAYVSAADTPAATGGDAAGGAPSETAGAPDAAGGAAGAAGGDAAAGAPGAGGATSGADAAAGDAPSFKASAVYAIVAAVVVVGCFF